MACDIHVWRGDYRGISGLSRAWKGRARLGQYSICSMLDLRCSYKKQLAIILTVFIFRPTQIYSSKLAIT